MKTETDRTIQTPDDVLSELRSLVNEAENIIHQSQDGNCESPVAALRERFETAQAKLADLYEGAKKKVVSGARYTDHAIRVRFGRVPLEGVDIDVKFEIGEEAIRDDD